MWGKCSQNCEGTAGAKRDLSSDSEVGSLGSPSSGWLCFFSPTEYSGYSLSMCCSKCITRQQKSEKVPMVHDGFQNSHSCHQPKTALQIKKEKQAIKKRNVLARVKSMKSVSPTSVALILHRLTHMLHFLYCGCSCSLSCTKKSTWVSVCRVTVNCLWNESSSEV